MAGERTRLIEAILALLASLAAAYLTDYIRR